MRTEPCAYFITFRTYGSWLHGDERSSVDHYHNIFESPKIKPNNHLNAYMKNELLQDEIKLTKQHGDIILDAALHVCNKYSWRLYSMHVRTNHVHFTVKSERSPEHISTQIKAHSTRYLREHNEFQKAKRIWSRGSSTRYLWTPESLYFANDYVIERQGQRMAYYYGD
jgi:REP element-mobilizing transposase RayT